RVDARDPVLDPALTDGFAHVFGDVGDGQAPDRSQLPLALEDLHRRSPLLVMAVTDRHIVRHRAAARSGSAPCPRGAAPLTSFLREWAATGDRWRSSLGRTSRASASGSRR